MEPTSLPDNEEGWVTDPNALEVLMRLRGAIAGDELRERSTGGHVYTMRLVMNDKKDGEVALNHFYDRYPTGIVRDDRNFTIIAWRRPRGKQHS